MESKREKKTAYRKMLQLIQMRTHTNTHKQADWLAVFHLLTK